MKDLSIYFNPIDLEEDWNDEQIGSKILLNNTSFPEIEKNGYALIYIPEFRGNKNGSKKIITSFREQFYKLNLGATWNKNFYDLGTILPGSTLKDTYFALANVVSELIKKNIVPIIIGGSQDLTVAMYEGYEKLEQLVNICSIDSSLDLGQPDEEISSEAYLSQILTRRPCVLFNHANIGLQIPYAGAKEFELFEKLSK